MLVRLCSLYLCRRTHAAVLALLPNNNGEGSSYRIQMLNARSNMHKSHAGMFWPVTITSCENSGKYRVVYDNGETELVKGEHVHNADAPVGFGREGVPLQV